MKKQRFSPIEDKSLFTRRKYDLQRIQEYIVSVDIIGINGIWGSGKTFLVDQLKDHLKSYGKYIFINIDLLSCNLDELQTILLNELERVLYERKIIPKHSVKLKRMLNENAMLRYIYMLFMHDDMSYSEALDGFMNEISLLNETIVIVYEDIDRISNVDIVKKIFSISEKLASKHIKIIYQYEETNLSRLGLEREYLEKYIPFVVNLTPIKFEEILEYVLKDNKYLLVEDFENITMPVHTSYYLEKAIGISKSASIQMNNIAIRKVKIFIEELTVILQEKEIYNQKEYKKTVINFYFIKHFFTTLFNQLNLEEGLLEAIKFIYEEEQYTIFELLAMAKMHKNNNGKAKLNPDQINSLLNIKDNMEKLFLLNLFNYDFEIEELKRDYNVIINESVHNITRKASNEKKDRLIWNLLCNGKSEYTDFEAAAYKLIQNVLSKPIINQKEAYDVFLEEMFHGKHEKKDNGTIFKIGIPSFVSLFQAFRVSNVIDKNWIKLVSFYFEYTKKNVIDIELIQILNYCNLGSREIYIYILKRFNTLEVVGNMNLEKCYKHFLKKFIGELSSLGYVNTPDLWQLDLPDKVPLEESDVKSAIKNIRKDLCNMRERIEINEIRKEIDIILSFLDKNIEIIVKSEMTLKDKEPRIHSEVSSKFTNQDEYNRVAELQQTMGKEQFMMQLEISYKNKNITAYEINNLLKK
jgi:hypothetical protein